MGKRKLPPYVWRSVGRGGRETYYFEPGRGTAKAKPRVRLPHIDEPEFWAVYAGLRGVELAKPAAGTFRRLVEDFQASPEFDNLAATTRAEYVHIGKLIIGWWGDLEVKGLEPRHVINRRDDMRDRPGAANAMLKSLSALLSWSVPRGYRRDNPVEHVRKLKTGPGYAPWPTDAIEHVEANAPAWMWRAAALALYTGQRQGDVLRMAWSHIKGGRIELRQSKTGKFLSVPVHAKLQSVLDSIPREAMTILVNSRGKPWTASGFRASWNKTLPAAVADRGLVFHGLRKSAVVMLLEAGCTDAEVAAITGQTRAMIEHYSKLVNQKRLASVAILKWEKEVN